MRKLLKDSSVGMTIIINILIVCLWSFLSFIISKHIGKKHVNYRKFPYRAYKFERKGRFYAENFDIDAWYGLLPIKYNRENINSMKIEKADILTLKNYLTFTCRSELCILINCLYLPFAFLFNAPYMGFILGILVVMFNLPFLAANRYVRFFLLNEFVKKRKEREIMDYIVENNPDKYDLEQF